MCLKVLPYSRPFLRDGPKLILHQQYPAGPIFTVLRIFTLQLLPHLMMAASQMSDAGEH